MKKTITIIIIFSIINFGIGLATGVLMMAFDPKLRTETANKLVITKDEFRNVCKSICLYNISQGNISQDEVVGYINSCNQPTQEN